MLYWDFSLFYNTVIRGNTALSQSKAVNLLLGQCIIPFSREKVSAFVTGEKKLPQHIVSRVSDRSESKHHIIIQQLELHDTYDCIRPLISTPSVISGIVDAQIIDNWRKLSYETRFEDIIINALLLAVNCTYSIASPVSTNIEKKANQIIP